MCVLILAKHSDTEDLDNGFMEHGLMVGAWMIRCCAARYLVVEGWRHQANGAFQSGGLWGCW